MTKSKIALEIEHKHKQHLASLYKSRLTHLKNAQSYIKSENYNLAVESYNRYLGVMFLYLDVTEDKFGPQLFNSSNDLTELLLISHAYWDLAKIYDMTKNRQVDSVRCLHQFIKFSQGYKFQHLNAQIVRKYIVQKKAYNQKAFEDTYAKLQINSKKCYVATMCFGENDPRTNTLRKFKQMISHHELGRDFIDFYYQVSPKMVSALSAHQIGVWFSKFIIAPLLSTLTFMIKKICSL